MTPEIARRLLSWNTGLVSQNNKKVKRHFCELKAVGVAYTFSNAFLTIFLLSLAFLVNLLHTQIYSSSDLLVLGSNLLRLHDRHLDGLSTFLYRFYL
jgi:hypothetical protein